MELEGAKGSAKLDIDYRLTLTTASGTEHLDVSPRAFDWTPAPAAIPESVLNIQRHFIDCLERGGVPDTSGEDNLKTLGLTFGAYRSAAEGRLIKLGRAG